VYLKRLDIHGFKSFAGRTTFEFGQGMTAIVGPNGSGKSNIADALRWVLGEQSGRLLRARKLDDIIYTGSAKRSAPDKVEVTLTPWTSPRSRSPVAATAPAKANTGSTASESACGTCRASWGRPTPARTHTLSSARGWWRASSTCVQKSAVNSSRRRLISSAIGSR
jgi:energy-coupling factor transporter ATP-binding protein EcfA2